MGIPDPHGAKQANKDIYHELYHGCTFSIIFFIIIIIIIKKKNCVTSPYHAKNLI